MSEPITPEAVSPELTGAATVADTPAAMAVTPGPRRRVLRGLLRLGLLGLVSAALLSAALAVFWPVLSATGDAGGTTGPADLPWSFQHTGPGNRLSVEFAMGRFGPTRWLVIPDDHLRSITINGRPVALDGVRPGGLQDFNQGFEIDLADYLPPGPTRVEMVVDNGGGSGGIAFRPVLSRTHALLLAACLLPLLWGLARSFGLGKPQILVLAAALALICIYWTETPWQIRSHDATEHDGHLGYVRWIAEKHALPLPTEGWTFYHPPVYYLLGAATWLWAQYWALPGAEALQALSIALWLVFLTAAAGALRRALRGQPVALFIATSALALWPAGIIHSVRIGNDAGLYAAAGVAIWFAIRWWQGRRRGDLIGMAIACAIALLCKSNAIALVAALGVLVALGLLTRHRRRRRRALVDTALFGSITMAGFAASFAVRIYYYLRGEITNWLISNTGALNEELRVPVELRHFLPLDVPTYLVTPWMDAGEDASGRANFWNYLLRSALTGEFKFPEPLQRALAFAFGALLLLLVLVLVVRLLAVPLSGAAAPAARTLYRQRPWILMAFFWLSSLLALRILTPFSCSNDFRYVLPVLIPACIYWSTAGRVPRLLLLSLTLCSAVFFATL